MDQSYVRLAEDGKDRKDALKKATKIVMLVMHSPRSNGPIARRHLWDVLIEYLSGRPYSYFSEAAALVTPNQVLQCTIKLPNGVQLRVCDLDRSFYPDIHKVLALKSAAAGAERVVLQSNQSDLRFDRAARKKDLQTLLQNLAHALDSANTRGIHASRLRSLSRELA
jgi:hypothetical protein